MITKSELEQRRTPTELREFVERIKETVRADETELHRGILKKELYKEFLDELVPLSWFALLEYPSTHRVQWVPGNQGYDALVYDQAGSEVDRVELTVPHDGATEACDAKLVVERGVGNCHVGKPGHDFDELMPYVLGTSRKKAQKDYSNCTLVVTIYPLTFSGFEDRHERQVAELVRQMSKIPFKAKRVFLLIISNDDSSIKRLEEIHG